MTDSTRVPPLADDAFSDEQRTLAAEIAGAREGVLGGPFAIWIRDPEIARRINHLSARLRKNSRFEKRLVELVTLVVTHDWKAHYAWRAHARQALAEGIAPEIVDAIRTAAAPAFARDDERIVYEVVSELTRTRALSDATYGRGLAAFGLDAMIELVTTSGLYTMIAMTLAAFDVPPHTGASDL